MALAAVPTPEGDAGEMLGVARRGSARLRTLIEDLLTYASVGSVAAEVEDVDLDALLAEVVQDLDALRTAAGAEITVEPLGHVPGHRPLLGQLFQNLLTNALKFRRPQVPPSIRIAATRGRGTTTVRVVDNGIGIAPEHRQDVFGVFTRLGGDDQVAGSGIGLATCAKVVANHGGRIWVEDCDAGGTAVAVLLPTA